MATQAQIKAVLEVEARHDGSAATLALELDAIPGAVWQTELQSLLPQDIRVSLFERGGQKCVLLTFPIDHTQRAHAAFEQALKGANEVSQEAHLAAAKAAQDTRERVAREQQAAQAEAANLKLSV